MLLAKSLVVFSTSSFDWMRSNFAHNMIHFKAVQRWFAAGIAAAVLAALPRVASAEPALASAQPADAGMLAPADAAADDGSDGSTGPASAMTSSAKSDVKRAPSTPDAPLKAPSDTPRRVISGHELSLEIVPGSDLLQNLFRVDMALGKLQSKKRLKPTCDGGPKVPLVHYRRERDGVAFIAMRIPSFHALKEQLTPTFWEGSLNSHDAVLCFRDKDERILTATPIELGEPFWGYAWAILAVLVTWSAGALTVARRSEKLAERDKATWPLRLWMRWNPLVFAVDRSHRYSLSLTQAMIWTYVTVFGLVFVWKITEQFLDVTPQVLILLGLGGGTALATSIQKLTRWQNVPERFRLMLKEGHSPRLADLLTEDGVPSVAKLQMLAFTLLIAFTVGKEIYEKYAFPALSDGLVGLMGISSTLYVANGFQKPESLETLRAKMAAFDSKSTPTEDERAELLQALRDYLT